MKSKFRFLFLLLAFAAHAKYTSATLTFNDGHTEDGFVSSFLNDDFANWKLFPGIEDKLDLYDASLRFKTDEKGDSRIISSDDLDQVTLHYTDGEVIYKSLIYRNVSANGTVKDSTHRIWLNLLRAGKINIYGYRYVEKYREGTIDGGYVFYFQNAKTPLALRGDFMENIGVSAVHNENARNLIHEFLKILMPDCLKITDAFEATFQNQDKTAFYRNYMVRRKEVKKQVKEQKLDKTETYFRENYIEFSDLLNQYEAGCPN